jgi:hypothetical protein
MKKRVIVVPKDKNAESALNYNNAKSEQLIELFLSEDEFSVLYNYKVFDLINEVAISNIDDYEDCSIKDSIIISRVISALEKKISINQDIASQVLVKKILVLFKEARHMETGVYFYF